MDDEGEAPLVRVEPVSSSAVQMTSRVNIDLHDSKDSVMIKNGSATQSQPTCL